MRLFCVAIGNIEQVVTKWDHFLVNTVPGACFECSHGSLADQYEFMCVYAEFMPNLSYAMPLQLEEACASALQLLTNIDTGDNVSKTRREFVRKVYTCP